MDQITAAADVFAPRYKTGMGVPSPDKLSDPPPVSICTYPYAYALSRDLPGICYDTACQQSFDMIPDFQIILLVRHISGTLSYCSFSFCVYIYLCV